jgi:peptidyl-dipeptidase A
MSRVAQLTTVQDANHLKSPVPLEVILQTIPLTARLFATLVLSASVAFSQGTAKKPPTPKTGAAAKSPGATRPDVKTAPEDISAKAKEPTGPCPKRVAVPKSRQMTADQFVADAEAQLCDLTIKTSLAQWVQENFITEDTDKISSFFNDQLTELGTRLAKEAVKYEKAKNSPDTARKLKLLKLALVVPAPSDPAERQKMTSIVVDMNSSYGKGKFKGPDGKLMTLNDAEKIMRESTDPEQLKMAWVGWHSISPAYRDEYAQFVQLGNKGAREQGYKDLGALWRSNYDMPPDEFAAEMERLWTQMKPLYDSLHAYVRTRLHQKYGSLVPEDGPIPAHLLANMWSQDWTYTYPLVAPPNADPGYNLDQVLTSRKTDAKQMVRYGENFYKSLGMQALPETFWERSLFTKPQDRDVVCHASAWDLDTKKDVRIKMCIEPTAEDFQTIHHELGHNYYYLAYMNQSPLYQAGANDGFHEAIGDTVALSVTPGYLKQIGLIEQVPDESKDMGILMQRALAKVAFLPFAYIVDQWRWKVFSGEIAPEDYNKAWWELRTKYQGIVPPVERSEKDFDPGAKYHVASNTPYARYFLATIYQYQFHRGLCRIAGYQGPLHRCSIYGNKAAGEALQKMLALGQSRPWPEALKALTGEDKLDASAMIEYFEPLKKWLDEQNQGHKVGWSTAAAKSDSGTGAAETK